MSDHDESGKSFGAKLWRSSFVLVTGAIVGVLFILAAGALLYWLEDKAINTAVSLEQGASNTVTVAADQVNPANNGKLVHVTGEATTSETINDPDFGISVQALRLAREVEMYQWKESKSESKKDSKKTVTYKYTQSWSAEKPGKGFAEPAGHANPAEKPYADSRFDGKAVKLGVFALNPKQVEHIPATEHLTITEEMLSKAPAKLRGQLAVDPEGYLFVAAAPGSTPDAPRVGDVRIRYKTAKPQTITVVAKQTEGGFEPFTPTGGEKVDLLKLGSHSAGSLFEEAQSSNQLTGWVGRGLSLLVMTFGLFLVIRLWKNASRADTGGFWYDIGLALLALCFAVPLLAAVAGGRWVSHQPPIGGGMLGGGVAVAGLLFFVARRKGARAERESFTDETESEDRYTDDSERDTASVPVEFQAQVDRAIELGAPVYNSGDVVGCYEIYAATARLIVKTFAGGLPAKKCLQKALDQCLRLDDPDKKAWTMRHAFDSLLSGDVEDIKGTEDIVLEKAGGQDLDFDLEKAEEKAVEKKPAEAPRPEPPKPAPAKSAAPAPPVEKKAADAPLLAVVCELCKKHLKISSAFAGKKVRCPACKGVFVAQPASA
jgi:hypothetical protein